MQMQVGEQINEMTTAPKVVQALDLRGVVVTGLPCRRSTPLAC